MPRSPPTTELDDLVKISPPPFHAPLDMGDRKNAAEVHMEHVARKSPPRAQPTAPSGDKDIKPRKDEVDVQRMVEETVRRVREQSDRCVWPSPWAESLAITPRALLIPKHSGSCQALRR